MERGIVEQIGTKAVTTRFGEKNVFNLKIDGNWLGCGFKQPDVQEGDYIEFAVEMNGKYKNINVDSIRKLEGQAPQAAPAVPTGGVSMSKDDYWKLAGS